MLSHTSVPPVPTPSLFDPAAGLENAIVISPPSTVYVQSPEQPASAQSRSYIWITEVSPSSMVLGHDSPSPRRPESNQSLLNVRVTPVLFCILSTIACCFGMTLFFPARRPSLRFLHQVSPAGNLSSRSSIFSVPQRPTL